MLAAYFCNWSIYGRNYTPTKLPVADLTHIIYAFFKTDPNTGTVSLSDPWADVEKKMDLGGLGCLGEFKLIKEKNPHLKVLLSIGGWTYSSDLNVAFADPAKVKQFAQSSVQLMSEHNLDGIDIDWEYPQNDEQAKQYVEVLAAVRSELDAMAARKGLQKNQFELTIAAPAGDPKQFLHVAEMNQYLDYWNIMSYDFAGSWSQTVDHLANVLGGPVNASDAIDFYITHGVAPKKLILGMPLYGRSFNNTQGIGQPFQGVLPGSFEQGVHDYKDLPLPGTTEHLDKDRLAAYCQGDGKFVSYDNQESIKMKGSYVRFKGLGGGMFWEASGDREGDQSLITQFAQRMKD